MIEKHSDKIIQVARMLRASRTVLFITGAGVSADSGLPTYRGVGGLYDVDSTAEGLAIEEILTREMLEKDPALTWKYLAEIGRACRGATFNRAHEIMAEAERDFDHVCVLTQNVDGFHAAAGSRNVIDVHGDLREFVCMGCGFTKRVEPEEDIDIPPTCPECDGWIRPDVVLFGEMIPQRKTDHLYSELKHGFDIVFSIGTSSLFQYISWPIEIAKDDDKHTVEINPSETSLSSIVDVHLPLGASVALDAIWSHYKQLVD